MVHWSRGLVTVSVLPWKQVSEPFCWCSQRLWTILFLEASLNLSILLQLFFPLSRFRQTCRRVIEHRMFDHVVLVFIFLNCITIALEHPNIKPESPVKHHAIKNKMSCAVAFSCCCKILSPFPNADGQFMTWFNIMPLLRSEAFPHRWLCNVRHVWL